MSERWHTVETESRIAIKCGRRTIAYVQVHAEEGERAALIAAAPRLLELAEQYASECGECAGTGITPDDENCAECRFIRDAIAQAKATSLPPDQRAQDGKVFP